MCVYKSMAAKWNRVLDALDEWRSASRPIDGERKLMAAIIEFDEGIRAGDRYGLLNKRPAWLDPSRPLDERMVSDKRFMRGVEEGIRDVEEGRVHPLHETLMTLQKVDMRTVMRKFNEWLGEFYDDQLNKTPDERMGDGSVETIEHIGRNFRRLCEEADIIKEIFGD